MRKAKKIVYPICFVIIVFSLWNLWKIKKSTIETEQLYGRLAEESVDLAGGSAKEDNTTKNEQLLKLQEQNPELAGWIRIPGTDIDYPVMQTQSDNDYYLTHDFEKNENVHGAPFLDVRCNIKKSGNLIIYGHNMKDGTMFQNLMLYKDPAFCESNGVIEWDTLDESAKYRVILVMLISENEADKFQYYEYTDFAEEGSFQEYLDECTHYAIWKSDRLPEKEIRLLTLSTCEYSKKNGRLVVVAERENDSYESRSD